MNPLHSHQLLEKTQALSDLPVLSVVREEGLELLGTPNSQVARGSRRDFARILKYDQVLSAKILRLVNSASFSLQSSVTDVETAVSFLGDQSLRVLFLGANVFARSDLDSSFGLADYWLHNYLVAHASFQVARTTGACSPSEAFSCGLLHDLGKLALWKSYPELFDEVRKVQQANASSFLQAEVSLGLPGHHVVGETLGRAWTLPFDVRKCMRFHHRDLLSMGTLEERVKKKVACVVIANDLIKKLLGGHGWGQAEPKLALDMQNYLGIEKSSLSAIEAILNQELQEVDRLWQKCFKKSTQAA